MSSDPPPAAPSDDTPPEIVPPPPELLATIERPLIDGVTPEEELVALQPMLRGATRTLGASLGLMLVWLWAFNLIVHRDGPIRAFFKILDGVNDLVMGALWVVSIGLGIAFVYTLTTLFTQTITNLYAVRLLEDLARAYLLKGHFREFLRKLLRFDELPPPASPFPTSLPAAILVLTYHYVIAWFYLVVFSECLWFAAWSAGVYLELFPETMQIVPMFAIAVPFAARLMAYFEYPYAEDYASFIPGILFVVVLLLAFVAYMGGPFEWFMVDIYERKVPGFFDQGALFWKFLLDGCQIAFYPVFGEVVFFFLQYQRIKRREAHLREQVGVPEGVPVELTPSATAPDDIGPSSTPEHEPVP